MAEFEEGDEEVCHFNRVLLFSMLFLIIWNYSSYQISVEEKLQITQHYLLSSPPGQFQEVLAGKFCYFAMHQIILFE